MRNPVQRQVREAGPKYRTRVVRKKTSYTRKGRNRRDREQGQSE